MNENIDLTKILKGCPIGTKLYSPIFGVVEFERVDEEDSGILIRENYTLRLFIADGKYLLRENGECLLFPSKDQRDWGKFERFWDKPKVERFDPKTFQPFDKVLVRNEEQWNVDFFNHPLEDGYIVCIGWNWKQCIPYNDDTKHLVGSKDDCPEFYKWWEK